MPIDASRYKVVQYLGVVPTFMYVMSIALLSIYDSKPGSNIVKPSWYQVTYAVRGVACFTSLGTFVFLMSRGHHPSSGQRLMNGIHVAAIMLMMCGLIYFDPATTVLLVAKNPSVIGKTGQGLSIAYMIVAVIYSFFYILSEWAGDKNQKE